MSRPTRAEKLGQVGQKKRDLQHQSLVLISKSTDIVEETVKC
jgi:hypothetical protein